MAADFCFLSSAVLGALPAFISFCVFGFVVRKWPTTFLKSASFVGSVFDMSFIPPIPRYGYVVYIDEAGDDGLNTVKPIDPHGSSEWLVLGAVVIDAEREADTVTWVREIVSNFRNHQKRGLHFRDLNPAKKRLVCARMATLPLRCFVVASNKKNMRGYQNPWAAQMPSRNWFYCWLTRLLLERVTYFVNQRQSELQRPLPLLKIEFSERGGMSYSQLSAYYKWLEFKSEADRTFLPLGDLQWDVMDQSLLEVHNHRSRAGLQLADVVASAFFKACDVHDTRASDPTFAKLLSDRMGRDPNTLNGTVTGYGVKLMPSWKTAKLAKEQKRYSSFTAIPESNGGCRKKNWRASAPSNLPAVSPASKVLGVQIDAMGMKIPTTRRVPDVSRLEQTWNLRRDLSTKNS
ncbi:MAG: DUF3800 domain-containing protein [Hyphomicrobiales bacterium]|nr:DUF3800 domain-containing protein [Hyphomicrobiales bacterium]